jgi:hypothetical protein
MASEKTRALRLPEPREQMITAGPSSTEALAAGRFVSTNRRNRLAIERRTLSRAQRLEIREIRTKRRLTGKGPEQPPSWAKYQKAQVDVRGLANALAQATENDDGGSSDPNDSAGDPERLDDPDPTARPDSA